MHGWIVTENCISTRWMTQDSAPSELLKIASCRCKKTKCKTKHCSCCSCVVSCTELCSCEACKNVADTQVELQTMHDDSESDLSDSDD
jgi:hypothetical protein